MITSHCIDISVLQAPPVREAQWKWWKCSNKAPSLTPVLQFWSLSFSLPSCILCPTHHMLIRPETPCGPTFNLTFASRCVAGLRWWLVAGPWTRRRGPSSSSWFSVSQSSTQRWALTCENELLLSAQEQQHRKLVDRSHKEYMYEKMCLIRRKRRLNPDDFIVYSYFGVFI